MQIPKIPTDNLYKFLSLAGIIILIFSIVYPKYLIRQLTDSINKNTTSIGLTKIETEYLIGKVKILKESTEKSRNELKKYNYEKNLEKIIDVKKLKEDLHDEKHRDYLKFIYEYQDEIIPEIKETKEYEKKLHELSELTYQNEINNYKTKRKNEIIMELVSELKQIFRYSFWGIIIGFLTMIIGFNLWYFKVQRFLDKKIELEVSVNS